MQRSLRDRRATIVLGLLAGAAIAVPACNSTPDRVGPPTSHALPIGTALATSNGFSMGIKALPGDEWVLNLPDLHNVSNEPVVIKSIKMQGTGFGSVISIKQVWVAPRAKTSVPD